MQFVPVDNSQLVLLHACPVVGALQRQRARLEPSAGMHGCATDGVSHKESRNSHLT